MKIVRAIVLIGLLTAMGGLPVIRAISTTAHRQVIGTKYACELVLKSTGDLTPLPNASGARPRLASASCFRDGSSDA